MAAALADITAFLDELLSPDEFADYGPNGLQVPGASGGVTAVATGVSGQLELFERAAALGCELVVVHHGILWDFHPRRIDRVQAARLRALLCGDIALAAYHLPLDAHPEHGNNALLAAALGVEDTSPFGEAKGRAVGVAGSFPGPGVAPAELTARVRRVTAREPLHFGAGPDPVRTIGIVSGSADDLVSEAARAGLDAYLTGEPAEHVMADAREGRIHFYAAGHYATETFGVRRLGDLLAERFGVAHHWVDLPNPV
ncbi:MAG: Nif3-like dinuclear metal center hexameric protein [Solirubrobacteraceae bacterium]